MHQEEENKTDLESILSKIISLEFRIKNLEGALGINPNNYLSEPQDPDENDSKQNKDNSESGYESRIGGFGLALLGNIVLLFGIIFLSQYIQNSGYPLFSSIFGYLSVIGVFLFSNYIKKKVSHLSEMLSIIGKLLLFYITIRLHYFSENPLISSQIITVLLLLFVLAYVISISVAKRSELNAGIAIFFALITGFLSNNTHVMLSLAVIVSSGSVFFFFKYIWKRTLVLSIFLVYLGFLIWVLTYSSVSGSLPTINFHQYCHLYLFGCGAIFSLITLVPEKDGFSQNMLIFSTILNGIFFSLILLIFIPTFFLENYTLIFIIISLYCMIFSIILKSYSKWKFAPAFYAMYGFVAISISVYGIFNLPYTFLVLTIQSLYVVAIALWFRSKIIIMMNTMLFFILLITYLITSTSIDSINFSFVAIAMLSARIINWKQKLLEIKTTFIRNFYLIITFFMALYSLYKAVPDQYITLSWTITAIVYFLLSLILRNIKYRWMAIATMIVAAFYLFIIDLSKISIVYRIIAFLFLAVISIAISLYYAKSRKTSDLDKISDEINTTEDHD